MNNQFRKPKEEEHIEEEVLPEVNEKAESPRNFFTILFTEGVISKQAATEMLPFIIFIAFLCMIYIGNRHFAENNIRDIDKLSKEVKELSWDFKTLKADLMLKSTRTEVAKEVDTLGLIEPNEPPKKILVNVDELK
ncbi:FtsL-like putative cell division protein [Daejeonella sp. H1SJ63]|uniref:FtsL-like putative cell division protein n=1 Tax=Daejeonella sp. H1SJ63 TaxID=3034145 RepID=UPI0023EB5275|nr:FtsL-like putative cell division protein [Daejeonella sp. H1SJ63]